MSKMCRAGVSSVLRPKFGALAFLLALFWSGGIGLLNAAGGRSALLEDRAAQAKAAAEAFRELGLDPKVGNGLLEVRPKNSSLPAFTLIAGQAAEVMENGVRPIADKDRTVPSPRPEKPALTAVGKIKGGTGGVTVVRTEEPAVSALGLKIGFCDGVPQVVGVESGSWADKTSLEPGWIVFQVNDVNVGGLGLESIREMILQGKGPFSVIDFILPDGRVQRMLLPRGK